MPLSTPGTTLQCQPTCKVGGATLRRRGYCLLYFPMSSLNGECVDFFIWWWVCWFFSPRNERVNFSQCSEGAKFVLPLPVCSCTEEPDSWCSFLPVGMLLVREWKWSVATFAAPQILLKFRFCLQNVSGGGNPNIKKMLYTNHGELFRIFDTFCRMWKAGRQATLTTSTEGGMLKANLDIQLGPPSAACPGDGER